MAAVSQAQRQVRNKKKRANKCYYDERVMCVYEDNKKNVSCVQFHFLNFMRQILCISCDHVPPLYWKKKTPCQRVNTYIQKKKRREEKKASCKEREQRHARSASHRGKMKHHDTTCAHAPIKSGFPLSSREFEKKRGKKTRHENSPLAFHEFVKVTVFVVFSQR